MSEEKKFTCGYGDFTIKKSQFNLYISYTMEGEALITSLTEWECESLTYSYLDWRANGFPATPNKKYDSNVGGKL